MMSLRRHILCNSEMSDEYDHVEGIKEAIRLLLSRRNTENYHNATKQASIIKLSNYYCANYSTVKTQG